MSSAQDPDLESLLAVLAEIDRLRVASEAIGVEPGSPVSADDAATAMARASHGVLNHLACAFDNMRALGTEIGTARTLHLFSPFSLLRVALENASAAVWLLAPASRDVRVTRRLCAVNAEIDRRAEIAALLGEKFPKEERRQQVREAAAERNLPLGGILGKPPGFERIVAEAAESAHLGVSPVLCWKSWSGVAHGNQRAAMSVLSHRVVEDLGRNAVVEVTVSTTSLDLSAQVVLVMLRTAVRLTRERFSNHLESS